MITYTIQKIEDDIILTLPETATYHNQYRDIYYLNNSKGIQIKRKYQPISTAHLESIKIEAENITSATSDDITFQFRTTTGGIVEVNCGENTSELVSTVTSQLTPQDFYLDAIRGGASNVHIADFINTVLIDVFTNATILDELCADDEVVANPCPDCPECPECPESGGGSGGEITDYAAILGEKDWFSECNLQIIYQTENSSTALQIFINDNYQYADYGLTATVGETTVGETTISGPEILTIGYSADSTDDLILSFHNPSDDTDTVEFTIPHTLLIQGAFVISPRSED